MGSLGNFLALDSSIHRPSSMRAPLRSKNRVIARISHRSHAHTHTHAKPRRDSTGIDNIYFSLKKRKSLPCTRTPTVTHQRVLSRACTHADKQRSPSKHSPTAVEKAPRSSPSRTGCTSLRRFLLLRLTRASGASVIWLTDKSKRAQFSSLLPTWPLCLAEGSGGG